MRSKQNIKSRKNRRRTWKRLTRKGGARDKLPLPDDFESAMAEWDFFYMSAHGTITDRMMIVPENTYILNLSTAGMACLKFNDIVENYIYEDPAVTAAGGSSLQKMFDDMKSGEFLKKNTSNPSEFIFTTGKIDLNALEQYSTLGRPEESTISFYEPGDIMLDTYLEAKNNLLPLLLVGAYKMPVPHSLREEIYTVNEPLLKPGTTIRTVKPASLNTSKFKTGTWNATDDHHQIFNIEQNILKQKMFPEAGPPVPFFHLSEVIAHVNSKNADGKKHFFMVKACRKQDNVDKRTLARRLSIAARAGRERVGIDPAIIAANPKKKFRSALNKEYLTGILRSLTNMIIKLPEEKALKQKEQSELIAESKKITDKSEKKALISKIYAIEGRIAEIDREIPTINEAIAKLNRILSAAAPPFTTEELMSILKTARAALQPEFKALLGIEED